MYPSPDKVKREFKLIVFNDNSVGIYCVHDQCLTFFDTETIVADQLIENLEALGEL